MPRNQLYQVRNGKTYRECNDIVYVLDGVATTVQKGQLSSWLKTHHTSGDDIPTPWYVEEDEDIVLEENIRTELEQRGEIVFRDYPNIEPEEVVNQPYSEGVKVVIYNIKQVPDDRRRTGYREYPRL